jgi:uncharacterized membrane protein YccC
MGAGLWRRLSSAQLNGIGVALGVALIQALFTALFGLDAGLAAAGGAVCTSLPDLPNPPQRVWRRLFPAALLATLVTLAVGLLRHSPVAMTLLIALIAFGTLMMMAWGPRAGPLSFTGVLALVFAMAWHAPPSSAAALTHAAWVLAGALVYTQWARAGAWLLRRRYRDLAIAAAMRACVARLRSRAQRIAGVTPVADASIRASIADDVLLADALQNARDQVFAARPSPRSRCQVDLVLGLIELRDLMLSIRLDVELLGSDAAGRYWRGALGLTLTELADALEGLAGAISQGQVMPAVSAASWREALAQRLAEAPAPADDARRHLVDALQSRLGHMLDDVAAMAERQAGPDRDSAWQPEKLQVFVSPQGWPLAALKPHLSLQSGVMRHALRAALALSLAYVLGQFLPWNAHPYWLVLSVAVVLRGNLEQTLSRRNERIIGTVLGCLLVLALAQLREPRLLALAFIVSVGVAHAYVNQRYRVAATAATLMALVQPLLLLPGSSPAIAERLADTVIGALLAWAFCFVLPSWERRSLQRLSGQLRAALARHAGNVLVWAPTPEQQMAQRLSRQQAYTALAALAAAAQRTRVEPRHVRLPEPEIEAVLSHGYRFMALLGTVQQMLNRRAERLDAGLAGPELALAREDCGQWLSQGQGAALPALAPGDVDWPAHAGQQDLTPWLLRRLRLARREAAALLAAEARLLLSLADSASRPRSGAGGKP